MGTKARVPRLDGAETEAGSRQRAKASQEQKEHPISKEAQLETQEKGPSTAFISSLLPKPCSQGTLLLSPPLKKKKKKTGHTPLGHSEVGPYKLTSWQDCQDVWGLLTGRERGKDRLAAAPSAAPAPVPSTATMGPVHQVVLPWLGPLPYRGQPQDCMAHSQTAGEALRRTGQELTRFGL